MTSYDHVRYTTHSQPETHPDRMAVIARLFGLQPAPVAHCRVLEIGCGDGNNLLPIAWSLPSSEFVGVDLAAAPIESGQQMIAALSLTNAKLVNADLAGVDESWGVFDYVIAHGFYSWVPPAARDKLLEVCRRAMAPQGVAFISYNAYPGCHMRDMMRQLMLLHVKDEPDPATRIQQARSLLTFLTAAQTGRKEGDPILAELKRTLEHTDAHLYHDDLAPINQPVWFAEFAAHASAHGLKYLSEADHFETSSHTFTEPVRAVLDGLRADRLAHEQYLDFAKFRRFRQTLLCHDEAAITDEPQPGAVKSFLISSSATERGEQRGDDTRVFETKKGARVETDHEVGLEALDVLQKHWPRSLAFSDLVVEISGRLPDRHGLADPLPGIGDATAQFLLSIYSAGVVEFHTHLSAASAAVGERPLASAVARWQLAHGRSLTTLLHTSLQVDDELERTVLALLDGTRDLATLRDEVHQYLCERGLLAHGVAREQSLAKVEAALSKNLERLAALGLLTQG